MRSYLRRPIAPLRGEGGYTLTEMLVVIGIICLIAAVLTPTVLGQMSRARVKAAQLQLNTVAMAVESFHDDVGRYPTTQEGLAALVKEPASVAGWTGPYAKASSLKDPWGRNIIYIPDPGGETFIVESYGPSGQPNGTGVNRPLTASPQ